MLALCFYLVQEPEDFNVMVMLMTVTPICPLFFLSEIPEDPLVAEEYYTDVFDSCSEESEEQEEDILFSGPDRETKDCNRTNQQVHATPHQLPRHCPRF